MSEGLNRADITVFVEEETLPETTAFSDNSADTPVDEAIKDQIVGLELNLWGIC